MIMRPLLLAGLVHNNKVHLMAGSVPTREAILAAEVDGAWVEEEINPERKLADLKNNT